MPISIKFLPENKLVEASQKDTILEVALRAGLPISHSCGGNGTCGTCRIWVREGLESLPVMNEIEEEMAKDRAFKPEERLSCQNYVCIGLVIELAKVK
ncbi:MAG: 2Fe-2S iron-sulfur cluster-binding protein [Pseudobdellovibrionaceae bacterium]